MHAIGCHETGLPFFWCPRCGTIRLCDGDVHAPALVQRCRQFGKTLEGECAVHADQWERLGVQESIGPVNEGGAR